MQKRLISICIVGILLFGIYKYSQDKYILSATESAKDIELAAEDSPEDESANENVSETLYEVADMIAEQENIPTEEDYLYDYKWYYKIYGEAVEIAEKQGIYQDLYLREKWISEEGNFCAYFVAEYSDSGIYLEARSKGNYGLTYMPSVYTDHFEGMDYRTLEIDEEKVKKTEQILLSHGINERCTLYEMDKGSALVRTSSGIWYHIDLTEQEINETEIDKENRDEKQNWENQGEWWEAYKEVLHDWTRLPEWEKEFADTLGGEVTYDPYLLSFIGNDLVYERYGLYDLDHNGIPELILMSDHSSGMNAIFTYKDRLIYCGTYNNALFTEDGKIIERGDWWAGTAMIPESWMITELKNGEIVYLGEIWAEHQETRTGPMKYMNYIGAKDETTEISYEEYREVKNELLYTANFIRNIDSEEIAAIDLIEYKKVLGGFVWEKAKVGTEEYTVKEKVISEQEGEWTMRVYYPYVSGESPVYAEINRSIEEEIARVCPTENNTISYDLFYEVRCLEQDYFSVLFYGMQYRLGAAHPNAIAWGVTYDMHTGRQLCITDIISLSALQSKLEQKKYIQVRGIKIEEYEAISGEEDWFHKYLTCSMDYRDKNHYNDFYLTDDRIGVLFAVSHAIGDYIAVEVE